MSIRRRTTKAEGRGLACYLHILPARPASVINSHGSSLRGGGLLGNFGNFGKFWEIFGILGNFGKFWEFWEILGILGNFGKYWTFWEFSEIFGILGGGSRELGQGGGGIHPPHVIPLWPCMASDMASIRSSKAKRPLAQGHCSTLPPNGGLTTYRHFFLITSI
jgi:hypothetical protein